jgi:hypothetical protein
VCVEKVPHFDDETQTCRPRCKGLSSPRHQANAPYLCYAPDPTGLLLK